MANMVESLAHLTGADLVELQELADRLPEVRDYYRGWRSAEVGQHGINNVLLFSRQSLSAAHMGYPGAHHRHVLLIGLAGEGEVEADGRLYEVPRGGAIQLSPFVLHRYPPRDRAKICWLFVTYDQESMLPELGEVRSCLLSRDAVEVLKMMLRWQLSTTGSGASSDAPATLIVLAAELLIRCLRAASAGAVFNQNTGVDHGIPAWLPPILDRLRHASGAIPRIEELAALAHVSPSYLRHQFKCHFGTSLGAYIRHVRVRQAMSKVINQRFSIGQAAESCGYSSVYAFSRVAKQVLGCAPGAYARQTRADRPNPPHD